MPSFLPSFYGKYVLSFFKITIRQVCCDHQELRYVFCTHGSRETVFRELRDNGRVWCFRTALRSHKLDHCGHFEPHIEVSTAIRSWDTIYKFTRSRDHLNRENEILHHYLKLWHQLFWIQHHKIDQKTLRTAVALEMHTELSGLLEYMEYPSFVHHGKSPVPST